MPYFVTGATGFIGKRLVRKLLARKGARCISSSAKGAKPGDKAVKRTLSPEAVALQQMMRGIHF